MASHQLTIPSFQPPETQALAEARKLLTERLGAAVRALNLALFTLGATGDLSDAEIEKSYERLAWAVDSFREARQMATLDQELAAIVLPYAGTGAQEGVRQ